jgi:hypothetical protein
MFIFIGWTGVSVSGHCTPCALMGWWTVDND